MFRILILHYLNKIKLDLQIIYSMICSFSDSSVCKFEFVAMIAIINKYTLYAGIIEILKFKLVCNNLFK